MIKRILLFAGILSLMAGNAFCQTKYPFDVKISGTGAKSIVFIPGLTSSGDVWNETVQHFDKKYKCYVLTFHGFAGVKPDSSANFKQWEESVARYVKANHLDKPIIIGHSIGGGMAMMLAADYPDLISKIVVVDALPCLSALKNPAFKAQENLDCSQIVNYMVALPDSTFRSIESQTIKSTELADTTHFDQVLQWALQTDRRTLGDIFCQFANLDLRDTIRAVQCPALILLEKEFSQMKPVIQEQFKNLKTADIRYSTKGLHFIMYDDPDWYFKQLDSFL